MELTPREVLRMLLPDAPRHRESRVIFRGASRLGASQLAHIWWCSPLWKTQMLPAAGAYPCLNTASHPRMLAYVVVSGLPSSLLLCSLLLRAHMNSKAQEETLALDTGTPCPAPSPTHLKGFTPHFSSYFILDSWGFPLLLERLLCHLSNMSGVL